MKVLLIILIILLLLVLISLYGFIIFIKRNGIHSGCIVMTKDENGTNLWKFSFNKGWDYEKMSKHKFVTFKVIKEDKNDG